MMKFFILRDATNNGVRLRATQVTINNIARHFQVDPQQIYLKNGNSLEFPEEDGTFQLNSYGDGTYFVVSSSNNNNHPQNPIQADAAPAPSQAQENRRLRRRSLCAVKITRADVGLNNRPENIHLHNLTAHINLYSEEEANVNSILAKVKEEMNDQSLVLVNNSCLEMHDQEGTRGLAFWKIGSRKIFAVPRDSLVERRQVVPNKRRRSHEIAQPEIEPNFSEIINLLVSEIQEMKEELHKYRKLCFRHKFSAGFLQSLEETFSCSICKRSPCTPPVVACQGCATIVGCQRCVNAWYSTNSMQKTCPKCRCPRGLSKTLVLKGFDDFIKQVDDLLLEPVDISSDGEESSDNAGAFDDTLPIAVPED